jgi:dTDP-4-dehydrorhamnose reductase
MREADSAGRRTRSTHAPAPQETSVRILILGGDGMLGHQLLRSWSPRHDVRVALHRPLEAYRAHQLFSDSNAIGGVEARDPTVLAGVLDRVQPDAVINCIGIVKQRSEAKAAIPSIEVNALLPHRLLELCRERRARLIHLSTDCVFSGRTGRYRQDDIPDPVDLYGRSKLLGEVSDEPGVTLRTSIIGLELDRFTGLVEWFLAERGMIRGFRRAIYSGLTTMEMARVIGRLLERHVRLSGVWHVASPPISKYDLLVRLARALGRTDIEIVPDDTFVCDRSLRAEPFTEATGYTAPSWDEMIAELAAAIRARGPRSHRDRTPAEA